MKLLLTSAGLSTPAIRRNFLKLLVRPLSKTKVIFVPTAARYAIEKKYVKISRQELLKLGIMNNHIKTLKLDHPISYNEVNDFDIIYVCGGNSFYLLYRTRENGFDKVIKKFLRAGGIYFGVSAGSVICGPDIATSINENDIGLKNSRGLNLIKTMINPHYSKKRKKLQSNKFFKYPVTNLKDSQALLVIDKMKKVIG